MLGSLTSQLGLLASQPGSAELRQAVLASLDNLQTQLNAPFLVPLTAGFTAAQSGVATAGTASMGAALTVLDTQFCQLRDALNTAYNGAFDVALSRPSPPAAWRECPDRRDDLQSDDNSASDAVSVSGRAWQQQRDIQHHASGGPGELSHHAYLALLTYLTVGK